MTGRKWARHTGLAWLAASAVLAILIPAPATAESIEAGKTRLELDRVLLDTLGDEGVRVTKLGQGRVQGRVITLPVDGGLIDLGTAVGSIDHAGGFKLRSGKRTVRLSELILDTGKRELYAKLNGERLRVASLKSYSFSRVGFGADIEVADLRLSRRTTSILNHKLLGFAHVHNEAGQLVSAPGGPLAALDLTAATVQLDPQTRTLSIANARATLEAPFANLINETFATPKGKAPILAAGDPLGTFSLTMQAR